MKSLVLLLIFLFGVAKPAVSVGICGDGICQPSETRQSCFIDCYLKAAVPRKHRLAGRKEAETVNVTTCSPYLFDVGGVTGIPVADDTLGKLISYRFLTELPGLANLAHGFNIFTGRTNPPFLFEFLYCNDLYSTVQDSYRNKLYFLPEQVEAAPYPTCSFDMESSYFSSASELASSMATSSNIAASLSGGMSYMGFSAAMHGAYSTSSSVRTALEQTSNVAGTTIVTSASCSSYSFEMRREVLTDSFHPIFLERLAYANSVDNMMDVLKDYGTFYYHRGDLGGSLSQIISTSATATSTLSSAELENSAQASFGASVSGWGISASASFQYANSMTSSSKHQSTFDKSSSKSDVITNGGAPGSFGPSSGDEASPTNWGQWAQTVDLVPIPINYKVKRIYDLLDPAWLNKNNQSIAALWQQAEETYYINEGDAYSQFDHQQYKLTILSTCSSNCGPYWVSIIGDIATSNPKMLLKHIYESDNYLEDYFGFNVYNITYPKVGGVKQMNFFDFKVDPNSPYKNPISNLQPKLLLLTDRVNGTQYYFNDFSSFPTVSPSHPGNAIVVTWDGEFWASNSYATVLVTITTTKQSIHFFLSKNDIANKYFLYPLTGRAGKLLTISFTPNQGSIGFHFLTNVVEVAEYFNSPFIGSIAYEYVGCAFKSINPKNMVLREISLADLSNDIGGNC